jgi:hypothetical protein
MAFLFHSQLGRFSAPEEVASGTDSDSYYGAGRRRFDVERESRREAGVTGEPGSRRHRRYLNSTFAEYESEYDTASDWDSDEDRPIVRFEWQARFVQAGQEFFEPRVADAPQRERRSQKLQRRVPKMVRRARGAAPLEHAPEEMESESHAHARRVRAAKFAAASAAHGAGGASASAVVQPAASATGATTTSATDSDGGAASVNDPTVATGLQRARISEKRSARGLAGQESAGTLFLGLEHGLRRALRKGLSAHEESFLAELEALLVAYKNGLTKRGVPAPVLFDVLAGSSGSLITLVDDVDPANADADASVVIVAPEDAADDTEATSDEEGVVHVSSKQKKAPQQQRRLACGDEPLNLSFHGPRERYLAHGMASFHQLVCESHDQPASSSSSSASAALPPLRVTQIRIPTKGVLLHDASLVRYLHKLQHVHSRSLAR